MSKSKTSRSLAVALAALVFAANVPVGSAEAGHGHRHKHRPHKICSPGWMKECKTLPDGRQQCKVIKYWGCTEIPRSRP